jgi:hypothetical protein
LTVPTYVRAGRFLFTRKLGSKLGWPLLIVVPWMAFVSLQELAEQGALEPLIASLVLGIPGLGLGIWISFKRSGFVVDRPRNQVTTWVAACRYRRTRVQAPLADFDRICLCYSSTMAYDAFGDRQLIRGYYLSLLGPEPRQEVLLWSFKSRQEGKRVAEALADYIELPLTLPEAPANE